MKKIIYGLIASVSISISSYAQDGKIITSCFSQSKSDIEIPSEIKSKNEWSEEKANQFITVSIYKKEYQAFISLTLDIGDIENVKIVSINAPKEVIDSGSFNPIETLRKIPCWTLKCVVKDLIDWFHNLTN